MNAKKLILTINVGSSSIKYSVQGKDALLFEENIQRTRTKKARERAVHHILRTLDSQNVRIRAVAHRVVHGGHLRATKRITPRLLKELKRMAELAPLHDKPELHVIEELRKELTCPHFAVFDTSFHRTLPDKAAVYAIPYKYFKKGIKRYGFHGISHRYITKRLKGKVISCHLGNGCSITAVQDGKSVDTTMGFTPLEGLIMGTRSGSIDPGVITYLQEKEGLSRKGVETMLNNESGLKGISGVSHDIRDLLASKKPRAKLAIEAFLHSLIKHVGAMSAVLGGADHIVFAGGIGENNPYLRSRVLDQLSYLGVRYSKEKNKRNAPRIETKESTVKVHIVRTDEQKAMAQEILARL